jgi:hypothetical protein
MAQPSVAFQVNQGDGWAADAHPFRLVHSYWSASRTFRREARLAGIGVRLAELGGEERVLARLVPIDAKTFEVKGRWQNGGKTPPLNYDFLRSGSRGRSDANGQGRGRPTSSGHHDVALPPPERRLGGRAGDRRRARRARGVALPGARG